MNDATFDEQIQFEPAFDTPPLVLDWDVALTFNTELAPLKFDDHAFAVHRLQQSWPEVSVHLDGAPDDSFRQCFDFRNGAIHSGW